MKGLLLATTHINKYSIDWTSMAFLSTWTNLHFLPMRKLSCARPKLVNSPLPRVSESPTRANLSNVLCYTMSSRSNLWCCPFSSHTVKQESMWYAVCPINRCPCKALRQDSAYPRCKGCKMCWHHTNLQFCSHQTTSHLDVDATSQSLNQIESLALDSIWSYLRRICGQERLRCMVAWGKHDHTYRASRSIEHTLDTLNYSM